MADANMDAIDLYADVDDFGRVRQIIDEFRADLIIHVILPCGNGPLVAHNMQMIGGSTGCYTRWSEVLGGLTMQH
jgi:hypothetical protein